MHQKSGTKASVSLKSCLPLCVVASAFQRTFIYVNSSVKIWQFVGRKQQKQKYSSVSTRPSPLYTPNQQGPFSYKNASYKRLSYLLTQKCLNSYVNNNITTLCVSTQWQGLS